MTDASSTLASGGNFGSTETKSICVGGATSGTVLGGTNSVSESVFGSLEGISVFPSPATTEVTIRAIGLEDANYAVYNAAGKEIARGTLDIGKGKLNVSNFKSGLYIIRASEGDKVMTTKFVKQ